MLNRERTLLLFGLGALSLLLPGCVTEEANTFEIRDRWLVHPHSGGELVLTPMINFSSSEPNGTAVWRVDSPTSLAVAGELTVTDRELRGSNTSFSFFTDSKVEEFMFGGERSIGVQGGQDTEIRAGAGGIYAGYPPASTPLSPDDPAAPRRTVFESVLSAQHGWLVAIWHDSPAGFQLEMFISENATLGPIFLGKSWVFDQNDFSGGATFANPLAGFDLAQKLALPHALVGEFRAFESAEETSKIDFRLAMSSYRVESGAPANATAIWTSQQGWLASSHAEIQLDQAGERAAHHLWLLVGEAPPEMVADRDYFYATEFRLP
jgi:hypothetical protein